MPTQAITVTPTPSIARRIASLVPGPVLLAAVGFAGKFI